MPTADTTETKPNELASMHRAQKSSHRRAFVVPAVLGLLAILAAACSSGGTPTASGSSSGSLISQGLSAEQSGNTQQAIDDFNAAATKDPTNPVAYYDLGVIYQLYVKQPAKAATYYNKALLANPKYKPAMYNLAIIDTSTNVQEAINLYNQLIQLNPNDSNALYNLGLILYNQGQQTTGDADIQKAILINPALKNRLPAGITP